MWSLISSLLGHCSIIIPITHLHLCIISSNIAWSYASFSNQWCDCWTIEATGWWKIEDLNSNWESIPIWGCELKSANLAGVPSPLFKAWVSTGPLSHLRLKLLSDGLLETTFRIDVWVLVAESIGLELGPHHWKLKQTMISPLTATENCYSLHQGSRDVMVLLSSSLENCYPLTHCNDKKLSWENYGLGQSFTTRAADWISGSV